MNKIFKILKSKQIQKKFAIANLKHDLSSKQIFTSLNSSSQFQIPLELQYNREMKRTKLENGIDFTTINSISKVITISVFIKCGSVNEKESESGTAHFLEHMHFKGTPTRSRDQLELEIENNGASLNAFTTREYTSYLLNVPVEKCEWGMELLSDILLNSVYNNNLIELERDTINTELLECLKNETETLSEFAHENSYRDFSISRPILGRRKNINSVTRQMIQNYHDQNYTGENLYFVVNGKIEHEEFGTILEKYFGNIKKYVEIQDRELLINLQKPKFSTKSMVIESPPGSMRMGFYWESCNWQHNDYIPFMLLQRMLGDYTKQGYEIQKKNASKNLIDQILQKDYIHRVDSLFIPYLQTGIFGTYLEVDENKTIESYEFIKSFMQNYINDVDEKDLEKVKNQIVPELLMIENGNDFTQDVGSYIIHLDRIVTRQEFVERVALCDLDVIKNVLTRWIVNKNFSLTVWGDLQNSEKVALHHCAKNEIIYDKTE